MGAWSTEWRRGAVRRLLQLDQPIRERSEAELTAEMEQNYGWNFAVNLGDGAFFWFGLSFISTTTILPLFVAKLTENPFWIALLAIIGQASWYLPQLFTANLTERLARKKPLVVNVGVFVERIPVWLLPLAAWFGADAPVLALVLFFVGYTWYGFGAGVIAPAWSDMIARCFPVNRRGRFFGFTAFVGTGLGALGAIFSSWLLKVYAFPINFVLCFLIAAVTITLSWFFIALTREPVPARPTAPRVSAATIRRKIWHILQGDHNFRRFLVARLLANIANMGAGFLTVAAIHHWQVADSVVGYFTIALLLGQTVGNLAAGLVADRYGHKLALVGSLGLTVVAYLLAWWAPLPIWYYPVFVLIGAASGISIVSGVLIALEFSRPDHRPTYIGIANTNTGIGNVIGPLLGGLLAMIGYDWLFLATALVATVALIMLVWAVTEPRRQREFFVVD